MIKVDQQTPVVVHAVPQWGIYHMSILVATPMPRQSLKTVHYSLDTIPYITMQDMHHLKHTYQSGQNRLRTKETYIGLECLICQQTENPQSVA